MSKNAPGIVKYGLIISVILLVVGYALFNSRIFIKGPQLMVSSPVDGNTLSERRVDVSGTTLNTSFISVNDRAISIDEQGNFNVPVLLMDGYNLVVIKAHDKFERQVTKTLNLVYNERNIEN
jgi:hypothetical protein